MKVRDIVKVIEDFAPISVQESWDNSGLCIGSMDDDVNAVLIGFDCTPALVEEAITKGADMIITHHPLIFRGVKKISKDNPVGNAIIKAISSGIAIYAAHTTADKVYGGVSFAMAEKLGLEEVRILDVDKMSNHETIADENMDAVHSNEIGLGVIGNLPQAQEPVELARQIKEKFELKVLKMSKPIDGKITKIAMCGGSGSSLIEKARQAGAELYISGDISYHDFFLPDGFMIMDIGHFESEVAIVDILYSLIKKKFHNFVVYKQDRIKSSNPIYYL